MEKTWLKTEVATVSQDVAFRYGWRWGPSPVAATVAVLTWNYGIPHGSLHLSFAIGSGLAWYGGLGPAIVAVVFSCSLTARGGGYFVPAASYFAEP